LDHYQQKNRPKLIHTDYSGVLEDIRKKDEDPQIKYTTMEKPTIKNENIVKALFLLPVVLFPGGVIRLKIFEPRYIRMIRDGAGDRGFVLCSPDPSREGGISAFGSWVKVIDFQTLKGNVLGIDVQAECVVSIEPDHVDPDRLAYGKVQPVPHWPKQMPNRDTQVLSQKFRRLYRHNDALCQLYPQPCFDNANWVCARWLENLPLPHADKALFFRQNSFGQAIDLLRTLLMAEKNPNE
jgi:Lon protease-like protein